MAFQVGHHIRVDKHGKREVVDTVGDTGIPVRKGLHVSYGDMANPRRHGRVIASETDKYGTAYVVLWSDSQFDEVSRTDLRQPGWVVDSGDAVEGYHVSEPILAGGPYRRRGFFGRNASPEQRRRGMR